MNPQSLRDKIASVGIWYHRLELGDQVTPGIYDMGAVVDHYRFPKDLSGWQVLDVGASNGFFSFHFESLGADRVVATELPSWFDHDYPRWYGEKLQREATREQIDRMTWDELNGGFQVAHEALDSRVERVLTRIYDLPDTIDDRFDLVFCSNVLVHLRDPVGALEAMREMLKPTGLAIFATPVEPFDQDVDAARFVGKPDLCAWWVPTLHGFKQWCTMAGCSEIEPITTFSLDRTDEISCVNEIGVIHCRR